MKKILNLPIKYFFILIFLFSIPAILPLFHRGFFPLHDSVFVARIYENYRGLRDFQFPVRWAMDFRTGEPLFNFYAPLPYYVGSLIHLFHFSFIDTSKILFGLTFVLSGFSMFLLSNKLFGKWGGLLSAALYMYAPYHSVDMYVRGALSEHVALVFFPLIFLYSFNLNERYQKKSFLLLTLSLAGLFITHNIMTVMFMPFFIAWVIYLFCLKKDLKFLKHTMLAAAFAFGLSAFYLLPAFFEKDLVQSTQLTSDYYNFRAHFVEISQFFSTFWGYGPSVWGPNDGLSFQVGLVHWGLIVVSLILLIVKPYRKKYLSLILFLLGGFLFSLFMQHNKSTPIWLLIPLLSFIQFPWRFLGISIFFASLMIGALSFFLTGKRFIVVLVVSVLAVGYYIQFFHPQLYYGNRTDQDYIADIYLKNEGFLPRDYVPIYTKVVENKHPDKPQVVEGVADMSDFVLHSSWAKLSVSSTESASIAMPISYFPGWTSKDNGRPFKLDKPTDTGLVRVSIPPGSHDLSFNFDNTPIRTLGDGLTIISIIIFGLFSLWPFRKGIWL